MLTPDQWTAIQDQGVGPCCGGASVVFLAINSIVLLISYDARALCSGRGVSVLSRKAFTQVILTPDQWTVIQDQGVGPCCGGASVVFRAIDSIVLLIPCGTRALCSGVGVSVLSRKAFTQVMLTPDQWTAIQDQGVGPCCGGASVVFLAIDSIVLLIPYGARPPCSGGGCISAFTQWVRFGNRGTFLETFCGYLLPKFDKIVKIDI